MGEGNKYICSICQAKECPILSSVGLVDGHKPVKLKGRTHNAI